MPLEPAAQHPSPDPGQGVFETILVFDDTPVRLEAHLERLAASVARLYEIELPNLRDLVRARARGGELGRMRLSVRPQGDRLEPLIVVAPFDPNNVFPTGSFTSSLETLWVDAGYGEHKWNDRDLLSRAEARAEPGAAPLLVRTDGTVFEASRANLFAVREGRVVTPPLDSEILPGIARQDTITAAAECLIEVHEEPLTRDQLLGADEVFLTNSLRGVEPIRALDGEPIEPEGPITTALAGALRTLWFRNQP
ncbi:MAG: para-aminobenzoate synthetase / 4-amino-4-deoxychorismate lyase [Solirubrobacterales bacterium]|jgi:branched-subunit amino acid aminotransferase/4-amino-4-deoxychorismate lyase|nr:para-aminobenzoate synthetase / 4-amino-4-deoxychorismate lyase [Solirubrobacterales bacterium]